MVLWCILQDLVLMAMPVSVWLLVAVGVKEGIIADLLGLTS